MITGGDTLFVYGTLRDDGLLASLVGEVATWRCLGAGSIAGRLYDLGAYPALRPSRRRDEWVHGVVIAFADAAAAFAPLDAYEGVDSGLYVRRRCAVRRAGVRTADAWVYVYSRPVRGWPRIAGGDWFVARG